MTIEEQEEVDKAFQKVVEQRNKDYATGRYWINGTRHYLEGAENVPKDSILLLKHEPKLSWIITEQEREKEFCQLKRLPISCTIYRYSKGLCMNCGHWKN